MSEDKLEKVLAILANVGNALEAVGVQLKHEVAEIAGVHGIVAVKEETFNILKFEKQQGTRIGEFEIAHKNSNIPEKFQSAFNILNKNNATISSRYYGQNYVYNYWLWKGNIYRQKLKGK